MRKLGAVRPTQRVRTVMFVLGDILIWGCALYAAYFIRFEGDIPLPHLRRIPLLLLVFIPSKILMHHLFRLYRVTWRLIGLTDLLNVWKASSLGSILVIIALLSLRSVPFFAVVPRSVRVPGWTMRWSWRSPS